MLASFRGLQDVSESICEKYQGIDVSDKRRPIPTALTELRLFHPGGNKTRLDNVIVLETVQILMGYATDFTVFDCQFFGTDLKQ